MKKETISILCSGVALGVYVPALIVNNQLQREGLITDITVLENLIFEEKRNNIPNVKTAFHRSFAVALTGQKLAKDISPSLDPTLVAELIEVWKKEERKKFIVFSGFWIPVLEAYVRESGFKKMFIHLCHIDADVATSFKPYQADLSCFQHIKFFNWNDRKIFYCLHIGDQQPVAYHTRQNRFVIHGGGWGMGTYKDKLSLLDKKKVPLDVIAYERRDIENRIQRNRYFMIDPKWNPWEKDSHANYHFPPFGQVRNEVISSPFLKSDGNIEFSYNQEFPEVYRLICQAKAIISKPGGATILDSLASATPIVLLEPFGEYEKKNALLWQYFGFGISYQAWIDSNCSIEILEQLHQNLLNAKMNVQNYVEWYYATSDVSKI
ncbi:MAG: hypothetical protein ACNYWU_00870 [Desulfobacterales bacterium]